MGRRRADEGETFFDPFAGLDLAAEWAGFATVGQCEWADYPTKVLEKHWLDVPRWRDIETLTKENFYERTGLRTVDIISGGFPCQPFSVAGKQKGKGDDRYLWPEMLRVIRELTPHWIFGENVPGIMRIAASDVVQDLERAGYHVIVFDFEAAAVGTVHRRERIAFVARNNDGVSDWGQSCDKDAGAYQRANAKPGGGCSDVANSMCYGSKAGIADTAGWQKGIAAELNNGCKTICYSDQGRCAGDERREYEDELALRCWWAVEPDVGRVSHGVPSRVDRLKCLGNAVVPQWAYPIFRAIAEEERRNAQEDEPHAE